MSARRPRVLIVSPDAVGERMRGMGIRYTELARALAPHADVVVATGDEAGGAPPDGVRVTGYAPHAPDALRLEITRADAIVAPPQWPLVSGWMRRSDARLIFDLYAPETLETLELFADRRPALRRLMVALTVDRLEDALRSGHHFMCAGQAQRDLYVGALLAARRLSPDVYDRDRSLRALLDVVPFGVPSEPPRDAGTGGLRAALPQIGAGDEVVLWNGGLWNWFDAPAAIRAVALLAARRPSVRLVFMGTGEGPAGRAAAEEAHAIARSLGLLGTTVLFNDAWVPYDQRAAWLLQADCAVATARDHLEMRFAFRTRLLDCFWAGLPVVCTRGDELAARVERDDLGAVVAVNDPEALAAALGAVLDRGRASYAPGLARAAGEHAWPVVTEPLRRWVTDPVPAPALPLAASGLRRPGHVARRVTYRAARRALQTAGAKWPSL